MMSEKMWRSRPPCGASGTPGPSKDSERAGRKKRTPEPVPKGDDDDEELAIDWGYGCVGDWSTTTAAGVCASSAALWLGTHSSGPMSAVYARVRDKELGKVRRRVIMRTLLYSPVGDGPGYEQDVRWSLVASKSF